MELSSREQTRIKASAEATKALIREAHSLTVNDLGRDPNDPLFPEARTAVLIALSNVYNADVIGRSFQYALDQIAGSKDN